MGEGMGGTGAGRHARGIGVKAAQNQRTGEGMSGTGAGRYAIPEWESTQRMIISACMHARLLRVPERVGVRIVHRVDWDLGGRAPVGRERHSVQWREEAHVPGVGLGLGSVRVRVRVSRGQGSGWGWG